MKDPLRDLKYQPWRSLLQVSGLTIVIVIFLELLLSEVYTQFSRIYSVLSALYKPPLGMVVLFAQAVGVGALAVYLLDRFFPRVFINIGSLWALVPCLALVIFLKSLLPVPGLVITGLNYLQLIGIMVGVFGKGRPYW
jgi:hypothetical protein